MANKQNLVLIKFGNKTLVSLVKKAEESGDASELAYLCTDPKHVPHYRHVSAASVEEHEAFVKYLEIMADIIDVWEKENLNER